MKLVIGPCKDNLGETFITQKFAFFPVTLSNHKRIWLKKYNLVEEVKERTRFEFPTWEEIQEGHEGHEIGTGEYYWAVKEKYQ